MVGLYCENFLE
jgi:hypothetical protein